MEYSRNARKTIPGARHTAVASHCVSTRLAAAGPLFTHKGQPRIRRRKPMHRSVRPLAAFLLCAGLILGAALIYTQRAGSAPLAQASGTFADPAFQQVWQRTDLPVQ